MFCPNCGNQVNEQSKFCPVCGTAFQNPYIVQQPDMPSPNMSVQPEPKQNRGYASMSFVFAIIGIFLCCIAPLFGLPAAILGGISIYKKEPESGKAYVGLILGALEVILYLVLYFMGD